MLKYVPGKFTCGRDKTTEAREMSVQGGCEKEDERKKGRIRVDTCREGRSGKRGDWVASIEGADAGGEMKRRMHEEDREKKRRKDQKTRDAGYFGRRTKVDTERKHNKNGATRLSLQLRRLAAAQTPWFPQSYQY